MQILFVIEECANEWFVVEVGEERREAGAADAGDFDIAFLGEFCSDRVEW